MARATKLKVYRTAIGFHDAYVAAPSQRVALEAWGSDKDLFARGVAEIVTDENLAAEPLASPGKVVKRLRGTAAEQMAALPSGKPKPAKPPPADRSAKRDRAKTTQPPPPPSRLALEEAEASLDAMTRRERAEIDDFERRQAELAKEQKRALAALAKEKDQLVRKRDNEAAKYDRAIRQWRSD